MATKLQLYEMCDELQKEEIAELKAEIDELHQTLQLAMDVINNIHSQVAQGIMYKGNDVLARRNNRGENNEQ